MLNFRSLKLLFLFVYSVDCFSQQLNKHGNFYPPLDIPLFLSANFGELRGTHFHSGIDFKTQQQTGKNVFAADEGFVSRIKVQSGSYGKSLYLSHPNGYTTVYAHLNDFIPEIESYITDYQYGVKKFEVDVYPKSNEFPVSRGQLIAKSGNTGFSGGPHLHFEIRDKNQVPLNVLQFNFNIKDNIKPDIVNLAIYPIEDISQINGKNSKLIIKPVKNNGSYVLNDSIQISGKAGFGIETYDYLNGSGNKCTVYSIELTVNDSVYYFHQIDKISFDEMKYISSHIDYEEFMLQKIKLHKLHPDTNNKLSIYKRIKDNGVVNFLEDTVYNVTIEIKDTYLNTASLQFIVKGSSNKMALLKQENDSAFVKKFYFNQHNIYRTSDFKILMQPNTLFKNIDFTYSEKVVDSLKYSGFHYVHSDLVPVGRSFTLSLKSKNIPLQYRTKALIACLTRDNKPVALGGNWNNGFVESSVRNFGRFYIDIDTVAPLIKPVDFKSNGIFKSGDVMSFEITDEFSGIKSYNGYIDNEWALFEYDAKVNRLSYRLDKNRVSEDGLHNLEIVVVDERNNVAVYRSSFYY